MIEAYYRTGQVSKLLKVSSYHIRRLCETGLIEAEFTGQQWKIPAREVDRLRKQGVPPLPQLSQDDGEEAPQSPANIDLADFSNRFYDGPSRAVIQSVEQVAITENRLKRRRLEKDIEETEDFFRERQRRVNAEQAVERERVARLQSEHRRQQWADRWIQYALKAVPRDAPQQITLDVHQMVAEALERLQPNQPEYIVRRVVDAAEEKALARWKRLKNIGKIIDDAREKLPYRAKGYVEPTVWETRVLQESAAEITTLRKDATYEEIRAVAIKVTSRVGAEFEHIETCKQILSSVYLCGSTSEELEEAKQAVLKALGALPVTASRRELEKARDAALTPFLKAIAAREEQARVKREAEQNLSRAKSRVGWRLPHVHDYLRKLEQQELEFEDVIDRWNTAEKLQAIIRQTLIEEVVHKPDLTDEQIETRIEKLVDAHLEEVLDD